jgi:transposase-like protein
MKQKKLSSIIASNPKEQKLRATLLSVKSGFFISKTELGKQLGCGDGAIEKWIRRWPWMKDYRVYIRPGGKQFRIAVFVNPKYKAQLLKQGIASENY